MDRVNKEILVNKREYEKLNESNSLLKEVQETQRLRRLQIMEQESNNLRQSKYNYIYN